MARLIFDTCILIAGARKQLDLSAITDNDDIAIPAVVVAEYLSGVLRTTDPDRQARERQFLDHVLASMPVIDYTAKVAEHHAVLLTHVRRTGEPRGAHDLIIAATARLTGRVLTTIDDRANFGELPGVQTLLLKVR